MTNSRKVFLQGAKEQKPFTHRSEEGDIFCPSLLLRYDVEESKAVDEDLTHPCTFSQLDPEKLSNTDQQLELGTGHFQLLILLLLLLLLPLLLLLRQGMDD